MSFEYNDGLCNGSRTPKLWVVHKGKVYTFLGVAMPGVVAITTTKYQKNGKWSNTTFQLELASGAVGCHLLAPLHGKVWPENDRMSAYKRFLQEYKAVLPFESFDEALLRDYPAAHQRMVEGEKALESLDAAGTGGAETVEISTSQSCNRNPHDDVRVTTPDGRTWVVAHEAQKGLEVPGVFKITDVKHIPGYRGGVTTLVFALAEGVSVQGEYYPKDGECDLNALGRRGQLPAEEASPQPETPPASVEEGLKTLLAKFGK